jgi:hypothetical protein
MNLQDLLKSLEANKTEMSDEDMLKQKLGLTDYDMGRSPSSEFSKYYTPNKDDLKSYMHKQMMRDALGGSTQYPSATPSATPDRSPSSESRPYPAPYNVDELTPEQVKEMVKRDRSEVSPDAPPPTEEEAERHSALMRRFYNIQDMENAKLKEEMEKRKRFGKIKKLATPTPSPSPSATPSPTASPYDEYENDQSLMPF